MDFGRIARVERVIDEAEWQQVINSEPYLEPRAARVAINPFTKEKIDVPGRGKALYLLDGAPRGNISLENGELLTTGVPKEICDQIAALLDAKVTEDDRS